MSKTVPFGASLAFEERMFPKLNAEIQFDRDQETRERALKSLCDLSHNQVKAYQICSLGLMDSIGKILDDPNDLCRELATEIFAVMCTHNIGRDAALKFIPKLSELFSEKNENTRKNVHKALYYSSELIRGVTQMIEKKLIPVFINLLKTEINDVRCWIIQTLHNCLRFASDEALQNQGFETLKELLEVDNEIIVEYSLRSLAEITFNSAGKARANSDEKLADFLITIIKNKKRGVEVRSAACAALGSVSITSHGKIKSVDCKALSPLCDLLQEDNSEAKLMSLTCISILSEVPDGRSYMLQRVELIRPYVMSKDELVATAAKECLRVIQWKP